MNSRQSAHGGRNVPRMKLTGKTFFVSQRHKALHRSTVNLLLHTCSKAAALPCTFLVVSHPNKKFGDALSTSPQAGCSTRSQRLWALWTCAAEARKEFKRN